MNIKDLLICLPVQRQRQDDTESQLSDLILIANRVGMYDAADVINHILKSSKPIEIKYGCYCDIELTKSGVPDGCVIDFGDYHDCIHAIDGMRKEQCEYWRPLK